MYADLPFGVNLVEDPGFEKGVGLWSTENTWLPGNANIYWLRAPNNPVLSGTGVMYVTNVSPSSVGSGGVSYNLGILPANTYLVSLSVYINSSTSQPVTLRVGRSDDVAAPAVIGSYGTPTKVWAAISGSFVSDGIHPSQILLRNEQIGSFDDFFVDQVAVVVATSQFHSDLYASMLPVADLDSVNGLALKRYLRAAALMFDQVNDYIRDTPAGAPGWSLLANPMTAPPETLDWLSQVSGTLIPIGTQTLTKRILIRDAPGRERGTRNAIIKSVQNVLTGTKFVAFHERDPDNNHFSVGVLKAEVPPSEWATNLISNPSFEGAVTTGWVNTLATVAGGVISIDSTVPFVGLFNGKVVTSVVQQGAGYSFGVLPAGTYAWTISTRGAVGGEIISIRRGPASSSDSQTTNWKTYTGTFVADGISTQTLRIETVAPTPAVSTIHFDAALVALSPIAIPYFDGPATTLIYNTVEKNRSVEFRQSAVYFLDDPWTFYAEAATILARVVGGVVVYDLVYPTYFDLRQHFTQYSELLTNTRHDWPNLVDDPGIEANAWSAFGSILINTGATSSLDTGTVLKGASSGRFVTDGVSPFEGVRYDLGILPAGTYSANIFIRLITAGSANLEFYAGPNVASATQIFSGSVASGSWLQKQGQFVADGVNNCMLVIRNTNATAKTVNFDLAAVTPGTFTFPSTF